MLIYRDLKVRKIEKKKHTMIEQHQEFHAYIVRKIEFEFLKFGR